MEVAIKTVVLSSDDAEQVTSSVAREAAIATNLGHANVVATYSHDVCVLAAPSARELGVCKIYLIQVWRQGPPCHMQPPCQPPLQAPFARCPPRCGAYPPLLAPL